MSEKLNITNRRFGHLVAIRPVGNAPNGAVLWRCRCDCGKSHTATASHLIRTTRSCGCRRGDWPHARKDVAGQRFGHLLALKRIGNDIRGQSLWRCRCDCGKLHTVCLIHLTDGNTSSCGCKKGNHKHGHAKLGKQHPLYRVWQAMLNRCYNPHVLSYKNYGGRGIYVCKRWHSFPAFLADVGERPPEHVLDRINNNGPYAPYNVRWATYKQSANNRRQRSRR
jgi:hypothetical protein